MQLQPDQVRADRPPRPAIGYRVTACPKAATFNATLSEQQRAAQ